MTIKTLDYIHKSLKEADSTAKTQFNCARRIENEYEKHDTDRNLIKQQRAAADEYMHEHLAALHALEEFENHEC